MSFATTSADPFPTTLLSNTTASGNHSDHGAAAAAALPLGTADYVAVAYCCVLWLVYFAYFEMRKIYTPHSTMSSHVDFHLVAWNRYIWSTSSLKIIIIQNIRSTFMVLNELLKIGAAGVTAAGASIVASYGTVAVVRPFAPVCLLFASLYNFSVAAFTYNHILMISAIDGEMDPTVIVDLMAREGIAAPLRSIATDNADDSANNASAVRSDTSAGGAPSSVGDPAADLRDWRSFTRRALQLRTTALSLQCQEQFRAGWRLLTLGIVATLWILSPIALVVGMTILAAHTYFNDYPFSDEDAVLFAPDADDHCSVSPRNQTPRGGASSECQT